MLVGRDPQIRQHRVAILRLQRTGRVRLAQTFHIPVASGVLTMTGNGEAYASIKLGSPGLRLPDLLPPQFANAASHYAEERGATAWSWQFGFFFRPLR